MLFPNGRFAVGRRRRNREPVRRIVCTMGAFVEVTLPVNPSQPGEAGAAALGIVEGFPGTRGAQLDGASGAVRFQFQFPGNLSGLVDRLRSNRIGVGDRANVSLRVRTIAHAAEAPPSGEIVDRLTQGAEVWDVQFDRGRYVSEAEISGDRIDATIVPSTLSMHQIFDALLSLGLVVQTNASAAGAQ
jgi:hypothetical protein